MRLPLIALGLTALWIGEAVGQSRAAPSGFEVASIKPGSVAVRAMHVGISPGGVFTADGVTLKALIQQAYDLRDFQILGGPPWLDKDTYDIVAKAAGPGLSHDQIKEMTSAQRDLFRQQVTSKLRALLEDRFELKAHREQRELPIYTLVVASKGPRIQGSTDQGGSRPGLATERSEAGIEISGRAVTVASLVKLLSNQLDRLVIDKTGLKAEYDFKLTYSPEPAPQPPDDHGGGDKARLDAIGPSIFTALQEQLGLKLQAERGLVPALVVDSARKASQN